MPVLERRVIQDMQKNVIPKTGTYAWVTYEKRSYFLRRKKRRDLIIYGPRIEGQTNPILADAEKHKRRAETVIFTYGGRIEITSSKVTLSGRPENEGVPIEPMSDAKHSERINAAGQLIGKIAGGRMNVLIKTVINR